MRGIGIVACGSESAPHIGDTDCGAIYWGHGGDEDGVSGLPHASGAENASAAAHARKCQRDHAAVDRRWWEIHPFIGKLDFEQATVDCVATCDGGIAASHLRGREGLPVLIAEQVVARLERLLLAKRVCRAASKNAKRVVDHTAACRIAGRRLSCRGPRKGASCGAGSTGHHHKRGSQHQKQREHADHNQQQHATSVALWTAVCGQRPGCVLKGDVHRVTLVRGTVPLAPSARCIVCVVFEN